MRMRFVPLLAIVALVALVSCDQPKENGVSEPRPAPRAQAPAQREPTVPQGVVVDNRAFGPSRKLADRAVKDLMALGFWKSLTERLYVVRIQSRLGRIAIPDDGHLADVLLQAQVDDDRAGALCNIMFFPTAINDDLTRWTNYYEGGYLPDPPPTLRQFWVSVLGHELAHCLPAVDKVKRPNGEILKIPVMSGEDVAERWEARVLARARAELSPQG